MTETEERRYCYDPENKMFGLNSKHISQQLVFEEQILKRILSYLFRMSSYW